jgi:hypothetical protein
MKSKARERFPLGKLTILLAGVFASATIAPVPPEAAWHSFPPGAYPIGPSSGPFLVNSNLAIVGTTL